MKDLKQYYCEVTQNEANEAKELLVKAGEEVWFDELSFDVDEFNYLLQYEYMIGWMVIHDESNNLLSKKLTYPQFKKMLIDKIKENGKRDL